jgi:glycosyltransferase involved in cell wall biosynthesis/SAM-dependent methyltransferase
MTITPTAIPDRKILSLSLFDVPLPAGGVDAFLDNTDSLWDAIEQGAKVYDLPVVQVFTIRYARLRARSAVARRGSTIFLFLAKRPLRNLVHLVRLIRGSVLVILHNESWSDFFSAFVGKVCGARIVMYYHNADKARGGKLPGWALRFFRTHMVDAAATSSNALKKLFKPSVSAPIYILPFGVDDGTFAYGERQPGPILRVLFCGRISREKRIEDIIQGIATATSRAEITLTIAGEEQDPESRYSAYLEEGARTLGVTLIMAGHVPHSRLRQRFLEADVLVNVRPDEGFGKVFVEAMATGLPVVGHRAAPGPSAIIRDGETGFLVDTPRQLGATLDRLKADPTLRTQVGRLAHDSITASFTTSRALQAAEKVFGRVLGGAYAERAFIAARSFPRLRRLKRLLLNQRIDVGNFVLVDNAPVELETIALIGYCTGRGIDVGCGNKKIHPAAWGIDLTMKGTPGRHGSQQGQLSAADIVATGEVLPFKDGSLDYLVARHNFEHYRNPYLVLAEWRRVVRIGGIIAFVLPDEGQRDTIRLDPTHYHVYSQQSFRMLVQLFGSFTIERLESCIEDWSFTCVLRRTA